MPEENYIYYGDSANAPYGTRQITDIQHLSRNCVEFLLEHGAKAIVIACNTASALALDIVRKETNLPILGVVVPGARAAVRETRNKKIGVIGTEATIKSEMYTKLMQEEDPGVEVVDQGAINFG